MQEEWKNIEGYEGLYQVSNLGRIKSLERLINHKTTGKALYKEKIMKEIINYGYSHVILCKNGKQKYCKIHRLVAQAFIPNPEKLPQVNHKDENKSNNKADNLEWCSLKYNINYGTRTERVAKTKRKAVLQCDLKGNVIKKWNSISEAEKKLNIRNENIVAVCRNRKKAAGGYIWKYEQIEN